MSPALQVLRIIADDMTNHPTTQKESQVRQRQAGGRRQKAACAGCSLARARACLPCGRASL